MCFKSFMAFMSFFWGSDIDYRSARQLNESRLSEWAGGVALLSEVAAARDLCTLGCDSERTKTQRAGSPHEPPAADLEISPPYVQSALRTLIRTA
jgi:hypothetical protein